MRSLFLFTIGQVIFFAIFISACTPHFYQPKPIEPVLLTKQDQLKINFIGDINLTAVSVAYSPKQKMGVQLGMGTNDHKSFSTDNMGRETFYLDEHYFNPYAAVGYYKNISEDFLFETYTGIGVYNYKNNAVCYLKKMNSINFFIQPSVAFMNDYFDAAFTVRVDYLNRSKTLLKDSVLSPDDQKKYQFLNYKSYLFAQPGLTIRAGFKYVKVQFQVSKDIPFNNKYKSIYGYGSRFLFDPYEERNRIVYGIGITAEINNVFKKKK
jgi:hypothetical protein